MIRREVKQVPFPEEAWIGLFAQYRDLVGATTEAPHSFHWIAHAVALAALVGRDAQLPWGAGQQVPVIHACLVGQTGKARKSSAIDDAIDILVNPLRPRASVEGEPDPFELVVGSGSGEGFAEAIADREYWPLGTNPKRVPPQVLRGRRALFGVHELGGLLEKIGRDQAGGMVDFIINSFDARKEWGHRTKTKELKITGGTGCFLCASTAQWLLENLHETHIRAGLMNRFLWVSGGRGAPLYRRPPIDSEKLRQYQQRARECIDAINGKPFMLTEHADAIHRQRYTADYDRESESPLLDDATSRADVLALRLSMVLAIGEGSSTIGAHHIKAAWAVTNHSHQNTKRLLDQMHEKTRRQAEERVRDGARRVAADKGGTFSHRDVYQRLKGRTGMTSDEFDRIFKALVNVKEFVLVSKKPEQYRMGDGGAGDADGDESSEHLTK